MRYRWEQVLPPSVGGGQLEQRRNYVWYWPRGPVSDRSPLGFITIVRMLRKAYVGAGVEVSREEQRRVHAWQINLARSYWLGGRTETEG